ncbi:hypothetical protein BRD01_14690, partial [Halobacteriales archaeon QS_8_65_32]
RLAGVRSSDRASGRIRVGYAPEGVILSLLVATPAIAIALWAVATAPAVAIVVGVMAAFATASVVVPYVVVRAVTALLERREARRSDGSLLERCYRKHDRPDGAGLSRSPVLTKHGP